MVIPAWVIYLLLAVSAAASFVWPLVGAGISIVASVAVAARLAAAGIDLGDEIELL